ncbi:hypothetical protein AB0C59_17590 [Streptomyces sp. NPDC048664]|uniref:hypothetical protein n=1 Tax=Streptomyces sp. NPDC048664 TaxID=3154505 RepID=UPI0034239492
MSDAHRSGASAVPVQRLHAVRPAPTAAGPAPAVVRPTPTAASLAPTGPNTVPPTGPTAPPAPVEGFAPGPGTPGPPLPAHGPVPPAPGTRPGTLPPVQRSLFSSATSRTGSAATPPAIPASPSTGPVAPAVQRSTPTGTPSLRKSPSPTPATPPPATPPPAYRATDPHPRPTSPTRSGTASEPDDDAPPGYTEVPEGAFDPRDLTEYQVDALVHRIIDRVTRQVRTELRRDRERIGRLRDPRH